MAAAGRPNEGFPARDMVAFNDPWHDSSFFLAHDGRLLHVESERLSRRKYDFINPMLVFCEEFPDLAEAFGTVAVQINGELFRFMQALVRAKAAGAEAPVLPFADRLLATGSAAEAKRVNAPAVRRFVAHLMRPQTEILLTGHHAAHAANAYYSSEFDDALFVSLDGGGLDFPMHTKGDISAEAEMLALRPDDAPREIYGAVYRCQGNAITRLHQVDAFSLGAMWGNVVTGLFGMKEGEEGTAMAMAALGDPDRFRRKMDERAVSFAHQNTLPPDRRSELDLWLSDMRAQIADDQDRYDAAAALQASTEARVRSFLMQHVTRDTHNLCLAGGTFLNCQITGRIQEWFPQIESVYMPPAPYDGGLSVGAAQLVHHMHFGAAGRIAPQAIAPFSMARHYSRGDVEDAAAGAAIELVPATREEMLALVAKGLTVGLFQGGAESGRRALGHRSIIAHPGLPGLKANLNSAIKHRQWFRPFAPMVLAEHVQSWFTCPPGFASPYMSFAVPVRPKAASLIANVVHLDGTARVQTVHRDLSPELHALLESWFAMTGLPVLLNTSFNDREPIVETPRDALKTFARTPIDHVYFADHGLLAVRSPGSRPS